MMKELYMHIGNRIREKRKILGLTQAEAAELLSISKNFYGDIERGNKSLSLEKIILIFEKFNMDPTYLLTGENQNAICELIKTCPSDKQFELEQIIRYIIKICQ